MGPPLHQAPASLRSTHLALVDRLVQVGMKHIQGNLPAACQSGPQARHWRASATSSRTVASLPRMCSKVKRACLAIIHGSPPGSGRRGRIASMRRLRRRRKSAYWFPVVAFPPCDLRNVPGGDPARSRSLLRSQPRRSCRTPTACPRIADPQAGHNPSPGSGNRLAQMVERASQSRCAPP